MPRDSRLYLRDMVDEARFIEEHTQGLAFDAFVSDEVLVRAVLNSLTVLGEAARAMPEEVRRARPEPPHQQRDQHDQRSERQRQRALAASCPRAEQVPPLCFAAFPLSC